MRSRRRPALSGSRIRYASNPQWALFRYIFDSWLRPLDGGQGHIWHLKAGKNRISGLPGLIQQGGNFRAQRNAFNRTVPGH